MSVARDKYIEQMEQHQKNGANTTMEAMLTHWLIEELKENTRLLNEANCKLVRDVGFNIFWFLVGGYTSWVIL